MLLVNKHTEEFIKLIDLMEEKFSNIDGPTKSFILRTAASYYENLTSSEAIKITYTSMLKNI